MALFLFEWEKMLIIVFSVLFKRNFKSHFSSRYVCYALTNEFEWDIQESLYRWLAVRQVGWWLEYFSYQYIIAARVYIVEHFILKLQTSTLKMLNQKLNVILVVKFALIIIVPEFVVFVTCLSKTCFSQSKVQT